MMQPRCVKFLIQILMLNNTICCKIVRPFSMLMLFANALGMANLT